MQWNYELIQKIKDCVIRWMQPYKLLALKQAHVHKRGHLKSFNIGRKPEIKALEDAVDEILECRYDSYEFLHKNDALIITKKLIDELPEYKMENQYVYEEVDGEWEKKIKLDIRWVERFMDRNDWTAVNCGTSKAIDIMNEMDNLWPHIVALWGLMLSCGKDPGKDLMNTDPTLLSTFFLKCKQLIKTSKAREHGGGDDRQNSMQGVGINYTIGSDGTFTNFLFVLVTKSKNYQLPDNLKQLILNIKDKDDKFDGGGSWDGWVKEFNELKRCKLYTPEDRLQFEYADNGDVLHTAEVLDYLLYQKHVYRVGSASQQTALANAADKWCQKAIKTKKAEQNLTWTGTKEAQKTDNGAFKSPSKATTIKHLYEIYKYMQSQKEQISDSFASCLWGAPMDESKDDLIFSHKLAKPKGVADAKYDYNVSNKTASETLTIKLKPGPADSVHGRGGVSLSAKELNELNTEKTLDAQTRTERQEFVKDCVRQIRHQTVAMRNFYDEEVKKRMNIEDDTPLIDVDIAKAMMHKEICLDYTMWAHNRPSDSNLGHTILYKITKKKPNRKERNVYYKANAKALKAEKYAMKSKDNNNNKSGKKQMNISSFLKKTNSITFDCEYHQKGTKRKKGQIVKMRLTMNRNNRFDVLKNKLFNKLQQNVNITEKLKHPKHWQLFDVATKQQIEGEQLIGTRPSIKQIQIKRVVLVVNVCLISMRTKKVLCNRSLVLSSDASLSDIIGKLKTIKKFKKKYKSQPLFIDIDDKRIALSPDKTLRDQDVSTESNIFCFVEDCIGSDDEDDDIDIDQHPKSKKKKYIDNDRKATTKKKKKKKKRKCDKRKHDKSSNKSEDNKSTSKKRKCDTEHHENRKKAENNNRDVVRNKNKKRKRDEEPMDHQRNKRRKLNNENEGEDSAHNYILCKLHNIFRVNRIGQIGIDALFEKVKDQRSDIDKEQFTKIINALHREHKIFVHDTMIHQL